MLKLHSNNHFSLRFRRWSRAGFAVFASLTCTVTIGVLAFSIAEKSMVKAVKPQICEYLTASDVESSEETLLLEDALLPLEIVIVAVNQINDGAAAGSALRNNICETRNG